MTRDIFKFANNELKWRGPVAYFDAARAAFWIMAGYKNRRITSWSVRDKKLDPLEAIPVWVSEVFPYYGNASMGDSPDPAYDQIVIARNWFVPGYNEEVIY